MAPNVELDANSVLGIPCRIGAAHPSCHKGVTCQSACVAAASYKEELVVCVKTCLQSSKPLLNAPLSPMRGELYKTTLKPTGSIGKNHRHECCQLLGHFLQEQGCKGLENRRRCWRC